MANFKSYLLWVLFVALCALILPVTKDEAYYLMWSQDLALGYFDHPPFISWLLAAFKGFAYSELFGHRLGTILTTLLTVLVISRILKKLNINSEQQKSAFYLATLNLGTLVMALLSTPDNPLLLFWALAVYEGMMASTVNPKRWLLAGFYCGLGLLSKYTMALMAPIYFLTLLKHRQLRSIWPYAGGFVALLLFLPNIYWNSQNNWTTFSFQLKHGFGVVASKDDHNALPPLSKAQKGSEESALGQIFKQVAGSDSNETKGESESFLTRYGLPIKRSLEFLASQLLYFGFFIFPMIFFLLRRKRTSTSKAPPIIWIASFFPLVFFGLISLVSKVEANWSAMYVVSAIVLAVVYLDIPRRWIKTAALLNVALFSLVVWHSKFQIPGFYPKKDRILLETHGYRNLAARYTDKDRPLLVETYQLASLLNYYAKANIAQQYPGITRDSELTRNPYFFRWNSKELQKKGGFTLLSHQNDIFHIEGFKAISQVRIQDCRQGFLNPQETTTQGPSCDPLQEWFETEYALETM